MGDMLQDIAIHIIIAASLVLAIASAIAGYSTGDTTYLVVLTSSLMIALLAAILYALEDLSSKLSGKRR